jgi:hypothetical protein
LAAVGQQDEGIESDQCGERSHWPAEDMNWIERRQGDIEAAEAAVVTPLWSAMRRWRFVWRMANHSAAMANE